MSRAHFIGPLVGAVFIGVLGSSMALAQEPPLDAGAPADAGAHAGADVDAGAARVWASCVEHVPPGAVRPEIKEEFPNRGFSGYASSLQVTVTHGKGETVIPEGFRVQNGSDASRALEAAGFVLPDPDGGSGPSIVTKTDDASAKTSLTIPFLVLPKDPGRNAMLLPPVPIAVSRANGEFITLCTRPHAILVDDPIANERDPKVKPNPESRPQREEWVLAKQLAVGILIGVVLGLIGAWLLRRWLRRPKVVPVVPPKLPWIAALEELDQIRRSKLLSEARTDEYFDRVSNCVRNYLGARYGFDGLECTTVEMQATLDRVRPKVPDLKIIRAFLADCDLVKFARLVPAEQDCLDVLVRGEQIVIATTPAERAYDEMKPPSLRRPRGLAGESAAPRKSPTKRVTDPGRGSPPPAEPARTEPGPSTEHASSTEIATPASTEIAAPASTEIAATPASKKEEDS
jgi:hypothetical protein